MPYRSEKIIIRGSQYDRRQKLTPEQKSEIAFRYATTGISQRKLAKEYGVSRRLITFIVNPEEENRNKQQLKIRKPDRAKLTKSVREYRRYKQKLFLEGKIQLTNSQ